MPMKQNSLIIDNEKKDLYQRELDVMMQKYRDKKSELQWADDEFEESLLQQEMDTYAKKIRNLKQALARVETSRQASV
jgi:predicted  nucleic acid-binding Zn-ribbon protein